MWGNSGKGSFYGLKLHLTSDLNRKILTIYFTPGNIDDRIGFKKMNKDFLIKTSLIVIFIMYCMTIKEIRDFLINNDIGRFINTLAVVAICLGFARCQALQGDIGKFGGDK